MIDNKRIRQLFLIILILATCVLVFLNLITYISGILGAIILYIILEPLYLKLIDRKWGKKTASLFLITASSLILLLPVSGIVYLLSTKVSAALDNQSSIKESVTQNLNFIDQNLPFEISGILNKKEIGSYISNLASDFASGGFSLFISLGVLYLLLFFMLTESQVWTQQVKIYLPLKNQNIHSIANDLKKIAKANAIGVPVVAILQGFIAVIGYYIFGVSNPWFWFMVTAIGSMIPFIGTAIGVVPACLILLSQGHTGAAIGMALFGLIVVGATDNLFRLVVQKRIGDIHPLITLFGVLIGIPLFGFMGLIFGPMIISCLLLLFKIYRKEYSNDKNLI